MAKTRVGIVGCGDVAYHTYLSNLARMHQEGILDFVAVCDVIPERVHETQRRTGVPQAYTDYDQMLAQADIDLVVNLTPTQNKLPRRRAAWFWSCRPVGLTYRSLSCLASW